ncbi:MAG: hypothetical protein HRT88_20180, partial [Lentisphaeraceae bacterium]|nr:hypothetical protein [Lentisphaeraceae bacterium]
SIDYDDGATLPDISSGQEFYYNWERKNRQLRCLNTWWTGEPFLKLPKNFDELHGMNKYRALVQGYESELQRQLLGARIFLQESFYLPGYKKVDMFNRYSDGRPLRHLLGEVLELILPFVRVGKKSAL